MVYRAGDERPHCVLWSKGVMGLKSRVINPAARLADVEQKSSISPHHQRLAGLGALSVPMIHDVNNSLMAILGHIEMAMDTLDRQVGIEDHLRSVSTAAHHAVKLCQDLRHYVHFGHLRPEPTRITDLIKEFRHLISLILSDKVMLSVDLPEDLPRLTLDRSQILIEVVEALVQLLDRGKGLVTRLWVRMVLEPADSGHKAGERELRVTVDDGHDAVQLRYEVTVHGEEVDERPVYSATPHWSASGRVLLVDDECSVRAVARQMLERIGFSVESAVDGNDALELFHENPDRFRCVVLDLNMPHMSGELCFAEMRRIRSDLPVLFSSGHDEQSVSPGLIHSRQTTFIQKPYSLAALRNKLQLLVG